MYKNFKGRFRIASVLVAASLLAMPQGLVQAKSKKERRAEREAQALAIKTDTSLALQAANRPDADALPLHQERMSLKDLGASRPLTIRGVEGDVSVGMSVRLDEVVESARLHLVFTLSPSLLPGLSHLKIMLNDEVLQTVSLEKDKLGTQQAVDIKVDPRYFTDYNRFRFQLIGHYTLDCETPSHSSLWASISNESYIDLGLRQVPLKNDLALLPAPFFDTRDSRPIHLPMIFGSKPSKGLLKASGSIATWMGVLATYRGTRFQVLENSLPDRHGIVLATNKDRPAFLKDLPPVNQPTLTMISHPTLPGVKLLLVLGQDDAQVQQAAEALAIGKAALSGQSMTVSLLESALRREAYDAPRWITTRRPVELGELTANAGDLQVRGTSLNDIIRINTRMAPDLFTWNVKGVPMSLQYRYTPTSLSDNGSLDLSINDQYIKSYPLMASGSATTASGVSSIVLPFFDDSSIQAKTGFKIPAFLIGGDNQLQLAFQIPPVDLGRCRSVQAPELRAAVDPQSTIDLTGFYHYIAMPNLAAYANSGFPFTKYADLAETSVVLPNQVANADIELYLTALARMGASTGHAGTRFKLLKASELDQAKGTDILLVSHADSDGVLAQWGSSLPALIDKGSRSIRPLDRALGSFFDLFSMDKEVRLYSEGGKAILEGKGELAAITGLQSPLDSGRSVVVLTATDASSLQLIEQALNDPGKVQSIRGDLSLLRGPAIESFRVNPVFYTGNLPWLHQLWFALHSHPGVLAVVGVLSGLFLSFVAFLSLRLIAKRRLEKKT